MLLEHVNLTVRDLDRSVAFYADLLDLSIRWKSEGDPDRRAAHVGDDRQYTSSAISATDAGSRSSRHRPA